MIYSIEHFDNRILNFDLIINFEINKSHRTTIKDISGRYISRTIEQIKVGIVVVSNRDTKALRSYELAHLFLENYTDIRIYVETLLKSYITSFEKRTCNVSTDVLIPYKF